MSGACTLTILDTASPRPSGIEQWRPSRRMAMPPTRHARAQSQIGWRHSPQAAWFRYRVYSSSRTSLDEDVISNAAVKQICRDRFPAGTNQPRSATPLRWPAPINRAAPMRRSAASARSPETGTAGRAHTRLCLPNPAGRARVKPSAEKPLGRVFSISGLAEANFPREPLPSR